MRLGELCCLPITLAWIMASWKRHPHSFSRDPGPCGALGSTSSMRPRGNQVSLTVIQAQSRKSLGGAGGLPFQLSTHLLCDLGQIASPL